MRHSFFICNILLFRPNNPRKRPRKTLEDQEPILWMAFEDSTQTNMPSQEDMTKEQFDFFKLAFGSCSA